MGQGVVGVAGYARIVPNVVKSDALSSLLDPKTSRSIVIQRLSGIRTLMMRDYGMGGYGCKYQAFSQPMQLSNPEKIAL